MTDHVTYTDEILVAYLDGELEPSQCADIEAALAQDAGLAERLADLSFSVAALSQALSPEALGVPAFPDLPDEPEEVEAPAPRRAMGKAIPLAMAASFLLGAMLTVVLQPEPAQPGWREAVASYQALYATETLAQAEQSTDETARVLTRATETIGAQMQAAQTIEGLEFKRAQMLAMNGKPLLQMAYLAADGTPYALCVIKSAKPSGEVQSFTSHDLAGASWVKDGVGYLLIGGQDAQFVRDLSQELSQTL